MGLFLIPRGVRSNRIKMADAAEAQKMSKNHQQWMIETLKEHNGSCSYEVIVEVGETKHCDTVGAMLKILKNKKVIDFNGLFLMYPMHKDEVITLKNPDYDPEAAN